MDNDGSSVCSRVGSVELNLNLEASVNGWTALFNWVVRETSGWSWRFEMRVGVP